MLFTHFTIAQNSYSLGVFESPGKEFLTLTVVQVAPSAPAYTVAPTAIETSRFHT